MKSERGFSESEPFSSVYSGVVQRGPGGAQALGCRSFCQRNLGFREPSLAYISRPPPCRVREVVKDLEGPGPQVSV